jgi:hypothetical protein
MEVSNPPRVRCILVKPLNLLYQVSNWRMMICGEQRGKQIEQDLMFLNRRLYRGLLRMIVVSILGVSFATSEWDELMSSPSRYAVV